MSNSNLSTTKTIIDQKPKSDYRLVLLTNNTNIVPRRTLQIESRKKFLFWEWWSYVYRTKGIETDFYLLEGPDPVEVAQRERAREEANHKLKLFRNEIPRYSKEILDQRD